jgi:predicted AlkP superfamily pyrophosphatase or phosphodiesterase
LSTGEDSSEGNRLTLCVFIDALGWEILQRHSFLDEILVEKGPLETIFGYSSTCDPTIITGKMPREHGHFAFFAYDPEKSPFGWYRYFAMLPRFLMERGRVRAKFSQIMKRVHGFTGYFQLYNMPFKTLHLFNYTEQANIFDPGGINGGQPTLFDHLRHNNIPFCRPAGFVETESIDEAESAIEKGNVPFVFLFLGRLDALLHEHGTDSPIVSEHIAWYEGEVHRLYEKASSQYEEVHLYLFSDHGMTDIREICGIKDTIDSLDLSFGVDYAAAYDSTMARFWFLRQGAREKVVAALEDEPMGRILADDELADYGCDFSGNTYGELFFLVKPGVLICPSHMGVKPLAGMHGFAPEDKDSTASFMSSVAVEPRPRRLEDLYALMRDDIGVAETDGECPVE